MNLNEIAEKWQAKRDKENVYKVVEDPKKPKFYILDMFPYPSGAGLHVGHPKGYIATDVIARKKTLQGFNVLHPMGFDTFGLGTEQYAIEKKMKPQVVAQENIENFKRQLKMFGLTYDRDRSFSTADPEYFKWTQRIFLKLYTHYYDEKKQKAMPIENLKGDEKYINSQRLAYVDFKPINRCPKCKTGLANEDLDDGKCERCATPVEQRPMKQRVLRITKYAERLLDGLDKLHRDEAMKDLERNWIGKSEGTEFIMNIAGGEKPSKVLVLHGLTGSSKKNRMPRIKQAIEKEGVEIFVPDLPNTDHPDFKEQLSFLEKNYKDLIDENTIIVGHSLGCFLAKQFIVKCNKKIKKFISVAPVHDELIIDDEDVNRYIKDITTDTKKLNKLVGETFLFISQNDPLIPHEAAKTYYEKSFKDAKIVSFQDKGHFSERRGNVDELPEIMEYIVPNLFFEVYTTRIDTVFGMSFVAMAPEHELVDIITTDEYKNKVEAYKEAAKHKTQLERTELQKDKSGQFTGSYAINPFNREKVPIYIADYVLANYGSGVVMAVPAHDERDYEFAQKYKLPIINSILPVEKNHEEYKNILDGKFCYTPKGILNNSGDFTGMESEKAITAMQKRLEKKGIGKSQTNFKMQDRVFSRQRYRGEPFPVARVNNSDAKISLNFYDKGIRDRLLSGDKSIESRALNPEEKDRFFGDVKEGEIINCIFKETGESQNFKVKKIWKYKNLKKLWEDKEVRNGVLGSRIDTYDTYEKFETGYESLSKGYVEKINTNGIICRKFEKAGAKIIALDENDLPLTLPDVENYEPTGTVEGPLANVEDRVNITLPDGTKAKRETNTMPGRAGSSRYWLRYMDPKNKKELVSAKNEKYRGSVDVYVGGAEHITRHMIYARFWQKFLYDIGVVTHKEPFKEYHYVGLIMAEDGRKMSKRRGNTIDPDEVIKEYGHDTFRVYEMFMGPFDQAIARSTNGVKGAKKFLEKIILLKDKIGETEIKEDTNILLNQTIKKLTDDIDGFRFNTCISQLMIFVNHLTELETIDKKTFETLTTLLSPFAPHLAEELRSELGNEFSVFTKATWPIYDEECLKCCTINMAVQINGKVRGTICVAQDATQEDVMKEAKADEKIANRITGEPKKIIYVQGKILNIVV